MNTHMQRRRGSGDGEEQQTRRQRDDSTAQVHPFASRLFNCICICICSDSLLLEAVQSRVLQHKPADKRKRTTGHKHTHHAAETDRSDSPVDSFAPSPRIIGCCVCGCVHECKSDRLFHRLRWRLCFSNHPSLAGLQHEANRVQTDGVSSGASRAHPCIHSSAFNCSLPLSCRFMPMRCSCALTC